MKSLMYKRWVPYLTLVLILLLVRVPYAQTFTASTSSVNTSLNTSSTGAISGTSFGMPQGGANLVTWQVVADGSALSVNLEGSLDNSVWFTLDSNVVAAGAIRTIGMTAVKFVRISAVSRTGGTLTTGTFTVLKGYGGNSNSITANTLTVNSSATGSASSSGFINSKNTFTLKSRNAADSADVTLLQYTSGNIVQLGNAGADTTSIKLLTGNGGFCVEATAGCGWNLNSSSFLVGLVANTGLTLAATAFASLPASTNGTILYCNDCQPTTRATCPGTLASCICATGGVGSIANRVNGIWYCIF